MNRRELLAALALGLPLAGHGAALSPAATPSVRPRVIVSTAIGGTDFDDLRTLGDAQLLKAWLEECQPPES